VPFNVGEAEPKRKASKRACKYGARVNGLCPKKPKSGSSKKGKKPCKYGRGSDGYCKKKPSAARESYDFTQEEAPAPKPRKKKASAAERKLTTSAGKVGGLIGEKVGSAAYKAVSNKENRKALSDFLKVPVSAIPALPALGKAAALGGVAIAGIAAFAITTYLVQKRAANKEQKQQQAFEVAQAYRQARLLAAEKQGKPLSAAQQAQLSAAFKSKLKSMGIDTSSLAQGLR